MEMTEAQLRCRSQLEAHQATVSMVSVHPDCQYRLDAVTPWGVRWLRRGLLRGGAGTGVAVQRMMGSPTFWDEAMDLKCAARAVSVSRHPRRPRGSDWLGQPAYA